MYKGIGVSPGIGIGRVVTIKDQNIDYTPHPVEDIEAEIQRFENALKIFHEDTEKSAETMRGKVSDDEIEIIRGHILMIEDPLIVSQIEDLICHGACAESALESVCDVFINIFLNTEDELIRMRAADVYDIKNKILKILLGIEEIDFDCLLEGTIIAMSDLVPSMTANINKEVVFGIITQSGCKTSHAAILLRSMGVPAVFSMNDAVNMLNDGDIVIMDGIKGEVIVNPNDSQMVEYQRLSSEYLAQKEISKNYRGKATVTADGIVKGLYCNIGKVDEAIKVIENDGEGVGLFRSEFLFTDRDSFPTEEEQFIGYKKVIETVSDKNVIIRTLDIGGDKEYYGYKREDNPFLGLRAVRYSLKNISLFKTQLKAIIRASIYGDVSIMIPLITSVDEVSRVKYEISEIMREFEIKGIAYKKDIKLGIMIETPAASLISDILAREVDFFSIGTNDLIQYTMAVDRGNADVAYIYSPYDPAVLRSVRHIISEGIKAGIHVDMCGEMASDPVLLPLLISFGLNAFSVNPNIVLETRRSISLWSKAEADMVTEKAMSFETVQEVQKYLESVQR